MIDKWKLVDGVVDMLKVNMGLKRGEKLVVVTDIPTADEWKTKESAKLAEAVERSLLAKMVSEIAAESFQTIRLNSLFIPLSASMEPTPEKRLKKK